MNKKIIGIVCSLLLFLLTSSGILPLSTTTPVSLASACSQITANLTTAVHLHLRDADTEIRYTDQAVQDFVRDCSP